MVTIKPYHDDCRGLRLDTGETAFFSRALTYVKQQTYDVVYTEYSAFRIFPTTSDAGPAAKSILWRSYDQVGGARIIASYADDLPKVGITAAENTTGVKSIGASYGWSLQDIRSAMLAGVALDSRLAAAAVRAHNQLMNQIAWQGDSAHNLPGLKSNSDIPTAAAASGPFSAATADQIIAEVNDVITDMLSLTHGVERPTVVAMPPTQLAICASKPRSTTSDTSVLSFLQTSWPGIRFEGINELEDWSGTDDALIAMNPSPEKMSLEIPQPYEEMPVERHALRFEVATHSRFAGLLVYYPKSVSIRTGI
jgi:hypothetical protein